MDSDSSIFWRSICGACALAARFVQRQTLVVLVVVFASGIGGILWYVAHKQKTLTHSMATQDAMQFSLALSEFRTIYTEKVVRRVEAHGINVTHDYEFSEASIPLPATLSMELGKRIGQNGYGEQAHLYSAYPFHWRQSPIEQDPFAGEAWDFLVEPIVGPGCTI